MVAISIIFQKSALSAGRLAAALSVLGGQKLAIKQGTHIAGANLSKGKELQIQHSLSAWEASEQPAVRQSTNTERPQRLLNATSKTSPPQRRSACNVLVFSSCGV